MLRISLTKQKSSPTWKRLRVVVLAPSAQVKHKWQKQILAKASSWATPWPSKTPRGKLCVSFKFYSTGHPPPGGVQRKGVVSPTVGGHPTTRFILLGSFPPRLKTIPTSVAACNSSVCGAWFVARAGHKMDGRQNPRAEIRRARGQDEGYRTASSRNGAMCFAFLAL